MISDLAASEMDYNTPVGFNPIVFVFSRISFAFNAGVVLSTIFSVLSS